MGRRHDRHRAPEPAVAISLPGRSWTAWFVPDVSLTAAFAAVVFCLFVFNAPSTMFGDSDTGWHIVIGDQMLRTHAVPHADPFSFLATGHGWYAWEWAAECIMAVFHRWRGLGGVGFLFTVAIGAAVWMCFRLHRRLGGDFFVACLMAAPLVATAQIHWLALGQRGSDGSWAVDTGTSMSASDRFGRFLLPESIMPTRGGGYKPLRRSLKFEEPGARGIYCGERQSRGEPHACCAAHRART